MIAEHGILTGENCRNDLVIASCMIIGRTHLFLNLGRSLDFL